MRLVQWPSWASWRTRGFRIRSHSRGMQSEASGEGSWTDELGGHWLLHVAIRGRHRAHSVDLRAFLHALRGRSGSTRVPVRAAPLMPTTVCSVGVTGGKTVFTDCTRFTDGTRFADTRGADPETVSSSAGSAVAQGGATVTCVQPAGAASLTVGTLMRLGPIDGDNQLCDVVAVSYSGAVVTLTFQPPARRAYAIGTEMTFGLIEGVFRLESREDVPVTFAPGGDPEHELRLEEVV